MKVLAELLFWDLSPWFVRWLSCLSLHMFFALRPNLFFKNTSPIGLGPTHTTSFYLNYFFKGPVWKSSHIQRYGGLALQHMSLKGLNLASNTWYLVKSCIDSFKIIQHAEYETGEILILVLEQFNLDLHVRNPKILIMYQHTHIHAHTHHTFCV